MQNSGRKSHIEKLSFIHPSFLPEKANQYILIFEFHRSEFTCCIVEKETALILYLKEIKALQFPTKGIAEIFEQFFFEEERLFKQNWKKIFTTIVSEKNTLVPASFYLDEKKEDYLSFNHFIDLKEVDLMSDYIRPIDSFFLYSVNRDLRLKLDAFFPSYKMSSSGSVFLSSVFYERTNKSDFIAIHIREHFFELVLFNEQLKLYNSFAYQGIDDFLYFLIAGCEQYKLDLSLTEIFIIGNCDVYSDLIDSIRNYFSKISFGKSERIVVREKELIEIPSHFYYTLFYRLHCE